MTHAKHFPQAALDEDYRSVLMRAVEAEGRPVEVLDVSGIFGLGGRPLPKIAFRVPVKAEDDDAVARAHRYAAEVAKDAGDGAEAARKDIDLLGDAKFISALWWICREAEPDPDDPEGRRWRLKTTPRPTGPPGAPPIDYPVFGTPSWMRGHLNTDQVAALWRLWRIVQRKHTPGASLDAFDDDAVEALLAKCAEHFGDDVPDAILAAYPHVYLAQAFIFAADKVMSARRAVDQLLKERDAFEARIAELEAQLHPAPTSPGGIANAE